MRARALFPPTRSKIARANSRGFSTECADQNRLDQLVRSNRADRRIIAAAVYLADHCLASLDRVLDSHRKIVLGGTYDTGLQCDSSDLDRDQLPVVNRWSSLDPKSTRRNVEN